MDLSQRMTFETDYFIFFENLILVGESFKNMHIHTLCERFSFI